MKQARNYQRGSALILAMILIAVLSVISVSLMFLSQTESWGTMNYKLMVQARDVAEAGINRTANYLLQTYTPPADTGADLITAYDITVSPVTAGGTPVILSSTDSDLPSTMTANYPVVAVEDAFDTNAHGTLTMTSSMGIGNNVNFGSYAELLSMRQIQEFGQTGTRTIQRWRITSNGSIAGVQNAKVEVSAILEKGKVPAFNYAVFGNDEGCDVLSWGGTNATTGSYSSDDVGAGTFAADGNVGTNGGLSQSGNTTINGSLSTPMTGSGGPNACDPDNVIAWETNNGDVTEGLIQLPQAINYPDPALQLTADNTTSPSLNINPGNPAFPTCGGLAGCTGTVPAIGNPILTFTPTCASTTDPCPAVSIPTYGNLNFPSNRTIRFQGPGTFNVNSMDFGANSTLEVTGGAVVFNLDGAGLADSDYVLDISGASISNASLDSANLQFLYAGESQIRVTGGPEASGLIYAPNADVEVQGNSAWYGAIIGGTVNVSGNAPIYYDMDLLNEFWIVSNPMLSSFTWKMF